MVWNGLVGKPLPKAEGFSESESWYSSRLPQSLLGQVAYVQ